MKSFLTAILIILVGFTTPALAQVIHRVHVGGPDACVGFNLTPGCDANFSLVALEFANGRVGGQYTDRFSVAGGGGGFTASIDCISVDGDDAWVSGVVTHGSIPGDPPTDLAGLPVWTKVRDNGTSANDPADQIGFSFLGDDTPCDEQPEGDVFDAPQGQVKVK